MDLHLLYGGLTAFGFPAFLALAAMLEDGVKKRKR